MDGFATKVSVAIAAACPIIGVSIGRRDDKSTWRIDFDDAATVGERAAAAAVLAALDPDATAVPQSVTPYQARRALNAAGLRDQAEVAIAAASQDVRDAWDYATVVERNSPFITAVGGALGLSEAQIDQLFIYAAGD